MKEGIISNKYSRNKIIGDLAEKTVLLHLRRRGFIPTAFQFRTDQTIIDLIVQKKLNIYLIEVKYSKDYEYIFTNRQRENQIKLLDKLYNRNIYKKTYLILAQVISINPVKINWYLLGSRQK